MALTWPWAVNLPLPEGEGYPAEMLRAQHYASTSGGNGVSSPAAMKVQAQPAADGTVRLLPGGADIVSTYDGMHEQSYYSHVFQTESLTVPATGSASGGRTDLVIRRICDPDYEDHPGVPADQKGDISPELALALDLDWYELLPGHDETANLPYPHVKLGKIVRPANTTIVNSSHIVDLRELANPKNHLHFRANNMQSDDYGTLSTAVTIWPTNSIHTMRIPEWATRVQIIGNWNTIAADTTNRTVGVVYIDLTHPDGDVIRTENSRFQNVRVGGNSPTETLNVILSDNRPVPEKFRGQLVTVRMRGTKTSGPNIYMDGNSSWSVQLFFEQGVV